MKYYFSILTVVIMMMGCGKSFAQQQTQPQQPQVVQQQKPVPPAAPTHLKFETLTKDFGDIPQGIPATTVFTFTNNSTAPVALTNVQKSCGCTEPTYSKDPVLPGKTSTISATYNAAAMGNFTKTLTVTTSENEQYILIIKGNVLPKQ